MLMRFRFPKNYTNLLESMSRSYLLCKLLSSALSIIKKEDFIFQPIKRDGRKKLLLGYYLQRIK